MDRSNASTDAVACRLPPIDDNWENPDAALGLPFDEDKATRANQLLTFRLTYGRNAFAPLEETATAFYPRGGISHGVTHERIAETLPTSD